MQSGRLDRKITILRKTETISLSGDTVEVWSPLIRRRAASIWPLKASEQFESVQKIATDQMDVRIRYSDDVSDLTPLDRIVYPALVTGEVPEDAPLRSIYDILIVQEIGRREGLKLVTERRPDILVVDIDPSVTRVPAASQLVISSTAPIVSVDQTNVNVSPAAAQLVISSIAPGVTSSLSFNLSPAAAQLVISSVAPVVSESEGPSLDFSDPDNSMYVPLVF